MDEDLETEEQSAEMPIEGMDSQGLAAANPALAPFMSRYFGAMEAESAALRQQAANRQKQFEAAEAAIRERRFGAPTTSEQLFALGSALLAPRRYRGLAGTLDKVNPVFGQMEQRQRSADIQRSDALEQLRREYLLGQHESALAAARAQREGLGKILPSVASTSGAATRARFAVDFHPEKGYPVFKNFNVPVDAVNALKHALQLPGATEQQKADTIIAFERKYKVPAATFIEGLR
jgi:hypothetical protein